MSKIPDAYWLSEIERKAWKLFRVVNGKGDAGSAHAFTRQNPEMLKGWVRLAQLIERAKR